MLISLNTWDMIQLLNILCSLFPIVLLILLDWHPKGTSHIQHPILAIPESFIWRVQDMDPGSACESVSFLSLAV